MSQAVAPEPETYLNLRVVDSDGSEICFKVKRNTVLKKLMDAYCQRMSTTAQSVRFAFDGVRINDADTPDKLGMEDNDLIGDVHLIPTDVTVEQKGGC